MRFGEYIRSLRVAAGMNAIEFGRLLGVSSSYVAQVERGKTLPTVERTQQIARELGVGVSDLVRRMLDEQIGEMLLVAANLLEEAGYRDAWIAARSALEKMPVRYDGEPEGSRRRRTKLKTPGGRKRLTRAHIAAGTRPW